ncbi:FAD-dependent oxidoreductase [Aquimarina sp. MMG016]|uniref:NAD(P)/FAD-dependent oxidoreductase n=1 Tax=Aquimarina sp. MMG016 TaxID=2822690 RepID=UPI001B39E43E|nr:FAD-dependent oxidoreductase [Aquimarina sp. MMG016]MBQ4819459.1 FAD-dependent oxidoreductase [Aquimarina sp. MMG016]
MNIDSHIIIIGGGLAGLTSAIHLAKAKIPVILIEKDTYPKHKVCGEYISNEVLPYLEYLDVEIEQLNPVQITKFMISTQNGAIINSNLPLGGFGVSRYALDHHLWDKARELGVKLINSQVVDIKQNSDVFEIKTLSSQQFTSKYLIGAYGKRSGLDRKLERSFSETKSPWLAVKAHYKADFSDDTVALHNFEGGYCGLSKIENNIVNACYLVHYDSFKKCKDINSFQNKVMCQNPHLKSFFANATPIFEKPITISQVNFEKKKPIENHIFMTGDAAGLIHPLCGNGMAMAIQGAQILSELLIVDYRQPILSRLQIEKEYTKQWKKAFSKRLFTGRVLQHVLLHNQTQQLAQKIASTIPSIVPKIIKQTHGKPLVC